MLRNVIVGCGLGIVVSTSAQAATVELAISFDVEFATWDAPNEGFVGEGDAIDLTASFDEDPAVVIAPNSSVTLGGLPTQTTTYTYALNEIDISLPGMSLGDFAGELVIFNSTAQRGTSRRTSQSYRLNAVSGDGEVRFSYDAGPSLSSRGTARPFDIDVARAFEALIDPTGRGLASLVAAPAVFGVETNACDFFFPVGGLCEVSATKTGGSLTGDISSEVISFAPPTTPTTPTPPTGGGSTPTPPTGGGSTPVSPSVVPLPASFGFLLFGAGAIAAVRGSRKQQAASA